MYAIILPGRRRLAAARPAAYACGPFRASGKGCAATMGYLLYAVVLLPIPLAAIIDIKTRRGHGLIVLILVAAALDIWIGLTIQQAFRGSAGRDNLDVAMVAAFYLLALLAIDVGIAVGALIVAALSHHRRWLIALVAALLAMAMCLIPSSSGVVIGPTLLTLALFLPLAVSFAYGVRRSVHPGTRSMPAGDRRAAHPGSATAP
jgi:hypothetical protein